MAGAMLKGDPLLAEPNTVTTTFPVVAAAGTVTTMLVRAPTRYRCRNAVECHRAASWVAAPKFSSP